MANLFEFTFVLKTMDKRVNIRIVSSNLTNALFLGLLDQTNSLPKFPPPATPLGDVAHPPPLVGAPWRRPPPSCAPLGLEHLLCHLSAV